MKKVIILAAGKSSRFVKSAGYMKQMIDIKGEPLLISNIKKLQKNGFTNIEVVLGYKSNDIINLIKKYDLDVKILINKNYKTTEMIESMLAALNNIDDTIFFYSDIFFDKKLLTQIKLIHKMKLITLPILSNWKNVWKKRNKIIEKDAESLVINKNNYLIEIGKPVSKNLPKFQFMGIVFIPKSYHKFFKKNYLKFNNKIQLTQFLNELLIKKIKIKTIPIKCKWYEFDDYEDLIKFNYNFSK